MYLSLCQYLVSLPPQKNVKRPRFWQVQGPMGFLSDADQPITEVSFDHVSGMFIAKIPDPAYNCLVLAVGDLLVLASQDVGSL